MKNPYHNKFHALDVLHSLFYFFDVSLLSEKIFPIDLLICVIAALGHDANHPGLDNFYQIISASDLALKYNDKSVLENMHCAEIFKLLSVKENNFLKDLENRDVTYMRKNIIELVLGTDFSTYFEAIGELSVLLENTSFKDFNLKNKMLILSIGLKCADIGHTAKETDLYIEWSRLITKEYQKQDHMEKSLNIEVSPIILQNYSNFLINLALPIYIVWNTYLKDEISDCVSNINKNLSVYFLSDSNTTTKAEIHDFPID